MLSDRPQYFRRFAATDGTADVTRRRSPSQPSARRDLIRRRAARAMLINCPERRFYPNSFSVMFGVKHLSSRSSTLMAAAVQCGTPVLACSHASCTERQHCLLFFAVIVNESAPIQLAQCRFPGMAISNAKILIYFSYRIYDSNFYRTALGKTAMV